VSVNSLDLGPWAAVCPASVLTVGSMVYLSSYLGDGHPKVGLFGRCVNITGLYYASFNVGRYLFNAMLRNDHESSTKASILTTCAKVTFGAVVSMGVIHFSNEYCDNQLSKDEGTLSLRRNINFVANVMFGAFAFAAYGSTYQGWRASSILERNVVGNKRG
jgi:hypothetical protein